MNFDTILELSRSLDPVYIAGHTNPDGDCIGATLSMAMLLEKSGIQAKVLLKDIPNTYHYLPTNPYVSEKIPKEVGLLIVMDCGSLDRLGDFEECALRAAAIVNIDHHPSNTNFGSYNHVNHLASSTSELLFEMLPDESLLDQKIAMSIYTGIVYDTGVFKHSCTTERTHQIAGRLIRYGFDFSDIIEKIFHYKTYSSLKTLSKAIDNIQEFENGKWVISYLTDSEINALNTSKKQTEGVVQILNEIKGVEVAAFLYEMEPHAFKVSLRSKGGIDVCMVAKTFGGGGHIKASGCSINGSLSEVIQKLLETYHTQIQGRG